MVCLHPGRLAKVDWEMEAPGWGTFTRSYPPRSEMEPRPLSFFFISPKCSAPFTPTTTLNIKSECELNFSFVYTVQGKQGASRWSFTDWNILLLNEMPRECDHSARNFLSFPLWCICSITLWQIFLFCLFCFGCVQYCMPSSCMIIDKNTGCIVDLLFTNCFSSF